MTLEQRLGGAELVENLVVGHAVLPKPFGSRE
jgi:hypothetical protein